MPALTRCLQKEDVCMKPHSESRSFSKIPNSSLRLNSHILGTGMDVRTTTVRCGTSNGIRDWEPMFGVSDVWRELALVQKVRVGLV